MHFNWITIKNFGPYREKEKISFSEEHGVYIIWGDNGRGKTSISNALNFLFFDELIDDKGEVGNYLAFINKIGQREGDYSFEVVLDATEEVIDTEGKRVEHYRVSRTVKPRDGVVSPTKNEDLISMLFVNKDGQILDSTLAKHIVDNIIPKEVARFFLFDGELLKEYAALLNEKSDRGERIKESIEQILGLPILTFGHKDIACASEKYSSEAVKTAANDEATAVYVKYLETARDTRQEHKKEKEKLEKKLEEEQKNKKRINAELKKNENYRSLLAKKDVIESKIKDWNDSLEKTEEEVVELLGEAWRWMLNDAAEDKKIELEKRAEEIDKKKKERKSVESVLHFYEEALKECDCPICLHHLNENEKKTISEKIDEITNNTINLSEDEKLELEKLKRDINELGILKKSENKANELKVKMLYINDIKVKISDCEATELKTVQEELDTYSEDEKEIMQLVQEETESEQRVGIYEEGINGEKDKIQELDEQIEGLNNKILNLSKNKDVKKAQAKAKYVESIREIFAKAIDEYRDKLKDEVEKDATELFLAMNDEPDYCGLRINENYGLSIIGTEGEVIPNRSAGWEHIVAFALIGALHKNAPLQGPVFMDSPFFRLSKIKKPNVVKALPLLSEQVILLVFPGEINTADTRTDLREKLIQEYKITRISSLQSTIEKGGI